MKRPYDRNVQWNHALEISISDTMKSRKLSSFFYVRT
jgi:hypothetical protein